METRRPCKKGHTDWMPNGRCRPCKRAVHDHWRKNTPHGKAYERARQRLKYLRHREARIAYALKWQAEHPEQARAQRLKYYYANRGVNYWVNQAKESV